MLRVGVGMEGTGDSEGEPLAEAEAEGDFEGAYEAETERVAAEGEAGRLWRPLTDSRLLGERERGGVAEPVGAPLVEGDAASEADAPAGSEGEGAPLGV
jgi:hypothetical protein